MAKHPSARLTLASGSPARRELLAEAGYEFAVMPANIDEPGGAGVRDIRAFVQQVAWSKAAAVAPLVSEGVVLAADTVAWIDGEVIGKPRDEADARRILRQLGGREHELWTGVCLWRRPDDLQLAWQEVTRVTFRAMTAAETDAYLATRQWQNNSGAYAIEGENDPHVRVVHGSLSNVIGLPMETTITALQWFAGVSPRDRNGPA
jgi:septum formation protein